MTLMAVDVDELLLVEFRKFAVSKNGRIHGVLKPEVEAALRSYLEKHKTHNLAIALDDRKELIEPSSEDHSKGR